MKAMKKATTKRILKKYYDLVVDGLSSPTTYKTKRAAENVAASKMRRRFGNAVAIAVEGPCHGDGYYYY